MTRHHPPTRLSMGVEEEFLLLDPDSRLPVGDGAAVSRLEHLRDKGEVQLEFTPPQIETSSSVCEDLDDLHGKLLLLRRELSAAARHRGYRLAAIGAPSFGEAGPPPVTDTPRYRRIHEDYGALVEGMGVCACHVHVGTPGLESSLQISNHLRPWLPALLLVTTNSPFSRGIDTGYASWRTALWARLPTAGPPPFFTSVEQYRDLVDTLLESGMVMDTGVLYWYVRPSQHLPTVEIRIADVAATVEEAVLYAGLVRALVTVAMWDAERGDPAAQVEDQLLQAACWRAARDGLDGMSIDLPSRRLVPSWQLLDRLVDHVRPALEDCGDLETVVRLLETLRQRGSGASRQRAVFRRRHSITETIDAVLAETMRGTAG